MRRLWSLTPSGRPVGSSQYGGCGVFQPMDEGERVILSASSLLKWRDVCRGSCGVEKFIWEAGKRDLVLKVRSGFGIVCPPSDTKHRKWVCLRCFVNRCLWACGQCGDEFLIGSHCLHPLSIANSLRKKNTNRSEANPLHTLRGYLKAMNTQIDAAETIKSDQKGQPLRHYPFYHRIMMKRKSSRCRNHRSR